MAEDVSNHKRIHVQETRTELPQPSHLQQRERHCAPVMGGDDESQVPCLCFFGKEGMLVSLARLCMHLQ